jgi:uncharacterized membrane protein
MIIIAFIGITVLCLLIADSYPKIGLALAALILLGAILLNVDTFQKLLNGGK